MRTRMSPECEFSLAKGIKDGLAKGKTPSEIGRTLSPQIKQKFGVSIPFENIRGRARSVLNPRGRKPFVPTGGDKVGPTGVVCPDCAPAIVPTVIIPPVPTGELTADEREKLEALEGIIKQEMGAFVAVGKALLTIRDNLLYREEYKTFPDYCTGKWGLGRHQAYNLIRGSAVATNLLTRVNTPHPCEIQPVHEKQVRPLSVLDPDQQCEVWEEAVRSADGKVVTYRQVKALVAEIIGPAAPISPKQKDPHAHSDAHTFVSMAMITLGRIRDDDPLRVEAMGRISEWIQEKLLIWTTKGDNNGKSTGIK